MLLKLIPSTESALYSRLLLSRITGRADYQPLTSVDDTMCSVRYFERLGQRVLYMAAVSYTHRQSGKRYAGSARQESGRNRWW